MLRHIVPAVFRTSDVETTLNLGKKRKGHAKIKTIGGGTMHIEIEGDEIKAGRGKITKADNVCRGLKERLRREVPTEPHGGQVT